MGSPTSIANDMTLSVQDEIQVNASLDTTFDALLAQLGPENVGEGDRPMAMKLEARPGGRWYRDLGDDNGHFWGHVQAIKRPTLLEITGPLFMSFAVASNVQYRLTAADGGTRITVKHSILGLIPDELRAAFAEMPIWAALLERVRVVAEDAKRT
jgi:uncharacterized protein YndB with AHSA1/START domain